MLKKWLKAGYIEKEHDLYPTKEGTPQGGIISPVMANMTLDGLETKLRASLPANNHERMCKYYAPKINLIRYADDFMITRSSKEQLENEVKPLVEQFMGSGATILTRENSHHAHRRRFRLLGPEPTEIQDGKTTEATHQALSEQRTDLLRKDTGHSEGK